MALNLHKNQSGTPNYHSPLQNRFAQGKILVVEDEPESMILLNHIFDIAGFRVESAFSGQEAVKKCISAQPNLIMLDLMMPEMDGWETYQQLRQHSDVPVIIISAIRSKEDVVRALRMGVDDYITKPFHHSELVERTRSVLRRSNRKATSRHLTFPGIGLNIDLKNEEVTYQQQIVSLSSKEFALLSVLAKHAPDLVPYHTIALEVWGEDQPIIRKRIGYLVFLLRKALLEVCSEYDLVITVDRLGYRLTTEVINKTMV